MRCEITALSLRIVDLFIPDWEGIQTGRSLFFTLAEASELLELINRDKCR